MRQYKLQTAAVITFLTILLAYISGCSRTVESKAETRTITDQPGRTVQVPMVCLTNGFTTKASTEIMADIAIECFARNLYNQGCLAVVSEGAKK